MGEAGSDSTVGINVLADNPDAFLDILTVEFDKQSDRDGREEHVEVRLRDLSVHHGDGRPNGVQMGEENDSDVMV